MSRQIATAILILAGSGISQAQLALGPGASLDFASVNEGRQVLTARDDYTERMSMFDRLVRMKTERDVTEADYLQFVDQQVLAWSSEERQKIAGLHAAIQARLEELELPFPQKILLVKTTGAEEAGAAYTRGEAVVLPTTMLAAPDALVKQTLCHELFHVLSRANPGLREQLYRAIGFEKCDEVELPQKLAARKITNPDAPRNDHCILINVDHDSHWAVPVLYSRSERYDVARGGELFEYLKLEFMLVDRSEASTKVRLLLDASGQPRLVGLQRISGLFEQIGRNTAYIIHPEEILADNFAMLISGSEDPASPEILSTIREILSAAGSSPTVLP